MNAFLVVILTLACAWLVWLSANGLTLLVLIRRWLIIRRIHKNLGVPWKAARRIAEGRY
jgi:hypothetical protein